MTLEERMKKIENKVAAIEKENQNKAEEKLSREQEDMQKIHLLESRIQALITLGNKTIDSGLGLPGTYETVKFGYGKGFDFCADGITHHVGFMKCRRYWHSNNEIPYNKIEYIGIENGGAFGVWDFYTNGSKTFLKHQENGQIREDVDLKYLDNFLKEFEDFESAFYRWIDSL